MMSFLILVFFLPLLSISLSRLALFAPSPSSLSLRAHSGTANADALACLHVQLWLALFRAELACGSELARRRNAAQV
jgi:hypothetical protein